MAGARDERRLLAVACRPWLDGPLCFLDNAKLLCKKLAKPLCSLFTLCLVLGQFSDLLIKGHLNFSQKSGRIDAKPSASQADRLRPVKGELARILDACLVRQPVSKLVIEPLREITRVKAL
jgi:hypothetical protein